MHGHWLKDYIGPKASASGGGTEPLIIQRDHMEGEPPNMHAVFDKTWGEVQQAFSESNRVVFASRRTQYPIIAIDEPDPIMGTSVYSVTFLGLSSIEGGEEVPSIVKLYASGENGYLQDKPIE